MSTLICHLSSAAATMAQTLRPASPVSTDPGPISPQGARTTPSHDNAGRLPSTQSDASSEQAPPNAEGTIDACLPSETSYLELRTLDTLLNYVVCEQARGRYAKPLEAIEDFYRKRANALSEWQRAELQNFAETSRASVAELTLEVAVTGASVWLDGARIGETPIATPIVVDRGTHRVRVERAGFQPLEEDCYIAGATTQIRLRLEPLVGQGELRVETHPMAAISIDGRRLGLGRWEGRLYAGNHTVSLTKGDQREEFVVALAEADITTLSAPMATRSTPEPDAEKPFPYWVYTVAGLVLIASGGTAAYLLTHREPDKPSPGGDPAIPLGLSF